MELRIVPEPPEPVRKALRSALEEVASREAPPPSSVWWRAGLAESVEGEAD